MLFRSYNVAKPTDEQTMREVLGYIGVANAGNWIITMEGKLRLVKLGDIPEESNLLVDDYGNPILFGEVRIIV